MKDNSVVDAAFIAAGVVRQTASAMQLAVALMRNFYAIGRCTNL